MTAHSSFTITGPAAWNSLPAPIRSTNSHDSFFRQLKTFSLYLCILHCINCTVVRRCSWASVEWRHSKLLWWWWWWSL